MQGYEAGSCDIVFATNVLHATRNMGNTLAHSKVRCQSFSAAHEIPLSSTQTPLLDGATLWEQSLYSCRGRAAQREQCQIQRAHEQFHITL